MESGTIGPMQIEADAFLPIEYGNFRIRVVADENEISIETRIFHSEGIGSFNEGYLSTKAKRMGHILPFVFNE